MTAPVAKPSSLALLDFGMLVMAVSKLTEGFARRRAATLTNNFTPGPLGVSP